MVFGSKSRVCCQPDGASCDEELNGFCCPGTECLSTETGNVCQRIPNHPSDKKMAAALRLL